MWTKKWNGLLPTLMLGILICPSASIGWAAEASTQRAMPQKTIDPNLQSVFDVMDYGAVGNDTGNDGPAIQMAVDAAAVQGGVVFFPVGTYRVGSTITVPGGVTLEGVGWNANAIPFDRGSFIHITQTGFVPIRLTGHGSGIRNMAIVHLQPTVDQGDPVECECTTCPWAPNNYPFAIEVTGQDVYIRDVLMRSATRGIRQLSGGGLRVDRLFGQVFNEGIVIERSDDPASLNHVIFGTSFNICQRVAQYSWENLDAIVLENTDQTMLRGIAIFRTKNGLVLGSNAGGVSDGLQVSNFDCDHCEVGILVEGDGTEARFTNVDLKGQDYFTDDMGVKVTAADAQLHFATMDIFNVGSSGISAAGSGTRVSTDALWVRNWSQTPGANAPALTAAGGATLSVGFTRHFGNGGGPHTSGSVVLDP